MWEPLELSWADVARLMQDPSPEVRGETAARVSRSFDPRRLNEVERRLAQEVLQLFARDAEVRVRRALSDALKSNPDVPHSLAIKLARDVADVAMPMLEVSEVLSDDDLLDIVRAYSSEHQAAIARRQQVSEIVAEALVDHGDEIVVGTLMGNEGAAINERAFHRALNRFGTSEQVTTPMVGRVKLPVSVAERLVTLVSDQLLRRLATRHELPPSLAADLLLEVRERSVAGLLGEGEDHPDVVDLVETLQHRKLLTPALAVRALCAGDVEFFDVAIAVLTGLPRDNAEQLIHDAGRRGLKALWENASLPPQLLAIAQIAIDTVLETHYDGNLRQRPRFVQLVMERLLEHYVGPGSSDDVNWLITRLSRIRSGAASGALQPLLRGGAAAAGAAENGGAGTAEARPAESDEAAPSDPADRGRRRGPGRDGGTRRPRGRPRS